MQIRREREKKKTEEEKAVMDQNFVTRRHSK